MNNERYACICQCMATYKVAEPTPLGRNSRGSTSVRDAKIKEEFSVDRITSFGGQRGK